MKKDKELEEAINILNNKIYSLNENIKIYDKGYDLSIKNELVKEKEAIEIVLQELKNSIPKKELSNYISKELEMIENNETININILDAMKAVYLGIKNIFLED